MESEKVTFANLPELSLQIVELAREHGPVTIGESVMLTGANRNTLKDHCHAQATSAHPGMHGKGRGARYSLR